jgi:hypothetical protein
MPSTDVAVPMEGRPGTVPNTAPEPKPKRISKRLQEAIRLLTTPECKTQKAAAEKLGMSPTYLCEALKKPEVRVFIERSARETIALGQLRASARLIELIDAGSEHVSADVSKHIAAIAGIKPAADPQVSVNIDIKAGYVIDLTDEPKHGPETMRTVNP